MIARFLDWIGSARRENDAITSDAVRITALELALRQATRKWMMWQEWAGVLQDKLDAANPYIEAGRKRKAADARYKARGK